MVAVMVLVDYKPKARLWGFMRLVLGALRTPKMTGLKFFKVLGSGDEGGFGLKPSTTRQGLFCVFDSKENADTFLNESSLIAQYKAHAREFFATKLVAFSSRGSWSGSTIQISAEPPAPDAPIATLTRASIRPLKAHAFWAQSPPSEASLEKTSGILLSTGLGEAPFFRQATFSIWESTAAMNQFARTGAHLAAIQAAHSGDYFSESMFVRFLPIAPRGVWKGRVFD
jgi:hypothetical protein